MQVINTELQGVKLLQAPKFVGDHGWLGVMFNQEDFNRAGLPSHFAQENLVCSPRGTLRGIHYQVGEAQSRLVRCVSGRIWDVIVDLRRGSRHFGRWIGFDLCAVTARGELRMVMIPPFFGHGFVALSESAEISIKTSSVYAPASERSVHWNDPALNVDWCLTQLGTAPLVSDKDRMAPCLDRAELP